jgi:hypothetical protein
LPIGIGVQSDGNVSMRFSSEMSASTFMGSSSNAIWAQSARILGSRTPVVLPYGQIE